MLADVFSSWKTGVPGHFLAVNLPNDHEVQNGQMLSIENLFPHEEHGLTLMNGQLFTTKTLLGPARTKLSFGPFPQKTPELVTDISEKLNYIGSIEEYFQWVRDTHQRSDFTMPIYRGFRRASFDMSTTFDRLCKNYRHEILPTLVNNTEDIGITGDPILEQKRRWFKDLMMQFITNSKEPNASLSPIEWLVYARHSGLPVPVLDYTFNPLIALYFALRFTPPSSLDAEDSIVHASYIRSGHKVNTPKTLVENLAKGHGMGSIIESTPSKNEVTADANSIVDQILKLKTGAINSPHSTQSARLQQSILVNISMSRHQSFYSNQFAVSHCAIKHSSKIKILRELLMLGIDESSIFESSDALSIAIAQRHYLRSSWPEAL